MGWLFGALALLLLSALLLRSFATASVAQVKRTGAVLLAALGLLAFGLLLYSGRIAQALPALLAMAPLLLRLWRGWRAARRFGRPAGRETRVETATLAMRLDLDTGMLSGRILSGPWAGRELGEMRRDEVLSLLADCLSRDAESVPLLENWLDHAHPGWREEAPPPPPEPMDRAAALALLGLREGASEAEIRAAYRQLMRDAHPDRGGSVEKAARLNQARDILLEGK